MTGYKFFKTKNYFSKRYKLNLNVEIVGQLDEKICTLGFIATNSAWNHNFRTKKCFNSEGKIAVFFQGTNNLRNIQDFVTNLQTKPHPTCILQDAVGC